MKIKCLIFDLDGTLFFTEKANYLAYKKTLKIFGINFKKETYKKFFGLRLKELLTSINPDLVINIKKIKELKSKFYKKNLKFIIPNTNLIEFLKYAKKIKLICCLATTASKKNTMMILNYFKIKKYFDLIITGDDVQNAKPHPECFNKCIDNFNLNPNECLIFEDSEI